MSLAGVFNQLGQTIIPNVAATVFPDLMNITGETRTQGTGGGQVKSASPNVYTNVPVVYEPMMNGSRLSAGDQSVSVNEYLVSFPVYKSGTRINIDPKIHKLSVLARGLEPAKVFKIKSIRDHQGVIFEAVCEKEN